MVGQLNLGLVTEKNMTATPQKTFGIGLALSGAISAGAYTAGVLDFLFQALSEWEKVQRRDQPGGPNHQVGLQVIAGASAGAITGALGVVALARGIQPQPLSDADKANCHLVPGREYQAIRCVLPQLYETWVTRPRMVDPEGGIDFLSDEGSKNPLVSILNSELLEDIKKRALVSYAQGTTPVRYPYIATKLHVFLTVSNLRGIPFTVEFGNSSYGMQTHGDRFHFDIRGLGSGPSAENTWINADNANAKTLCISDLPKSGQTIPTEWELYGTCALASSAFPIGLAPRRLSAPFDDYSSRPYPIRGGRAVIKPTFPTGTTGQFTFLNVDGGVINNNPFDFAQFALMGDISAESTSGATADRAVIMVSPFPEPPPFLPESKPVAELVPVIRALFPALINQARFKVEELVPALDPNDHSRFLIAPHRALNGKKERYTIACGLLGGFGGFLDEKFRAHDFQLGRRNCQNFLRLTFGLTADNPRVANISGHAAFRASEKPQKFAIIPLVGEARSEVPLPHWPQMSQSDFDGVLHRVRGRLSKVAPRFVKGQTSSPTLRGIAYVGLFFVKNRVSDYIRFAILSDLVRRDQIQGWELPDRFSGGAEDVRAILAALANPAFTFRTPGGIAADTHLTETFVNEVLEQLGKTQGMPYAVWQGESGGKKVYTLTSRQPKGFWSLPGIREIVDWIEAPTID